MELTTRLGKELIQRQAIIVLYNHLNTKIAEMNGVWAQEDADFYSALNLGNVDFFVEPIEDFNFYAGTIPSLINAPIENYPNVCAICYFGNVPSSSDDTGELYNATLGIEIMVKSLDSEQEVNSRIQKTLDAVHLTFMDSLENRTLNNTILSLNAPVSSVGDVFARREKTSHGDRWYWQGGALQYTVNKYVNFSQS
jgi:hypothetical protein